MLIRDALGYLLQGNRDYPGYLDAGDTASRTGLMAMASTALSPSPLTKLDQSLLHALLDGSGKLMRHPSDPVWADARLTSRDQLVCWAAGVFTMEPKYLKKECQDALLAYARTWFINSDLLTPDVKLMLYKVAGAPAPLGIRLFGTLMLAIKVLFNTKIVPDSEQNQLIAQCSVAGVKWLSALLRYHPDLERNLINYWSGKPWRDQSEIATDIHYYIINRVRSGV